MQAVELRQQGVGVLLNMVVIVFEDIAKEFVFGVMDSFDDVLVIPREVEEATTLAWRSKLRQDIFACQ